MLDFKPLENRIVQMKSLLDEASQKRGRGYKVIHIIQEITEVLEHEQSRVDLAVKRYADGQQLTWPYTNNSKIYGRCAILDGFLKRTRKKIETAPMYS